MIKCALVVRSVILTQRSGDYGMASFLGVSAPAAVTGNEKSEDETLPVSIRMPGSGAPESPYRDWRGPPDRSTSARPPSHRGHHR